MKGISTLFFTLALLICCTSAIAKSSVELEKMNRAYEQIVEAKRLLDAKKHCAYSKTMYEVERILKPPTFEYTAVSKAETKHFITETIKENDKIVASRKTIKQHSLYNKYSGYQREAKRAYSSKRVGNALGHTQKALETLKRVIRSDELAAKERISANDTIVKHNSSIRSKRDYKKYTELQAEAHHYAKKKSYEKALEKAQEAHIVLITLVNPKSSVNKENYVTGFETDAERKQLLIDSLKTINKAKGFIKKEYLNAYHKEAREAYNICFKANISLKEFKSLAVEILTRNTKIANRNAALNKLSDFWMYKKRQDKGQAFFDKGRFNEAVTEGRAAYIVLKRLLGKVPKRKG